MLGYFKKKGKPKEKEEGVGSNCRLVYACVYIRLIDA